MTEEGEAQNLKFTKSLTALWEEKLFCLKRKPQSEERDCDIEEAEVKLNFLKMPGEDV